MDRIIAHDNIATTRNVMYNEDHDHVTPGDQVDYTTYPTVKQSLKEKSYALGGVAHELDKLLALHGMDNRFQSISDDQFRDDAAATMIGYPASHADGTCEHIERLPSVKDHNNGSSTMLATLRDQAYASFEGLVDVLGKDLNADSHELAYEVSETRGAIQTEYPSGSNTEVTRDVGWHKANIEIPDPLIGGYTNGELFAFIRRFNKVGLSFSRRNFHRLIAID
ncbi:hypothetical protein N7478_010691 [Penicillium angulare]|uniref:uncharacterized protein n=1 Tax=Penicillium angulare TaxID=116970 RepID=UPI002541A6C5|nr:uncharacterized protein N7478_010691 [Penicillium angulare]KAJ5267883.1 hypothetical protein N7478_010691 [Penicillium angulare]